MKDSFNKRSVVHLFDSIPDQERNTARELIAILDKKQASAIINPVEINRYTITTKDELFATLDFIADSTEIYDRPIIHTEAHGIDDATGIVLADGSRVQWNEIIPFYSLINGRCADSLILSNACCYGYKLYDNGIVAGGRRCCRGLFGPDNRVRPGHLLKCNEMFLTEVLKDADFDAAAEKAKQIIDPNTLTNDFGSILFPD